MAVLRFLAICASVMTFSAASAATIDWNGAGTEIVGVSGVEYLGARYDVTFSDVSCVTAYAGCDELADFPISAADNFGFVLAVSAALYPLGSQQDIDPTLINGCSFERICAVFFAHGFHYSGNIAGVRLRNDSGPGAVSISGLNNPATLAFLDSDGWTNWTTATVTLSAVSLPASLSFALLAIGSLGLMSNRRRRNIAA